jgi:hypothetical protein
MDFRDRCSTSKVSFLLVEPTDSYAALRKQQSLPLDPECGVWQCNELVPESFFDFFLNRKLLAADRLLTHKIKNRQRFAAAFLFYC